MTSDSNKSISVLIVDDEILAREGIHMVLDDDPNISAVHEARDGKQALQSLRAHKPDVVFMDVQMPERIRGLAKCEYGAPAGYCVRYCPRQIRNRSL
jgi:DNA-binding NarL/FixJ family response regulator